MTRILPAILFFVLVACSGIQTRAQKIDAACASAVAALRVVTVGVQNGKVTREQKAQAVAAGDAIAPVCAAPERPTLDAIKQRAFDEAVARIAAIAAGAQ